MRKIKTMLLISLLSVHLFASAGGELPEGAFVPWLSLGVEGAYLQTSNAELIYAQTAPSTAAPATQHSIKPGYRPSLRVKAHYHFQENYDLGVNWLRLRNTASATSSDDYLYIPNTALFPSLVFNQVDGNSETAFDVVNLEVGKTLPRHEGRLQSRVHVGLQWLNLNSQLSSIGHRSCVPERAQLDTYSRFTGLGLRAGSNSEYELGAGFSLTGEIAAAVAFGQHTFTQHYQTFPIGDDVTHIQARSSTRNIVPSIEGRVGFAYTHQILTLEAGYQIAGYFNSVSDATYDMHNFGYQGPYLGLKLAV